MKKIVLSLAAVATMALLSSCDTKLCYCYNYVSSGHVTEEAIYTDLNHPCDLLSSGYEGSTGSRVCVEANERMDPGSLASK